MLCATPDNAGAVDHNIQLVQPFEQLLDIVRHADIADAHLDARLQLVRLGVQAYRNGESPQRGQPIGDGGSDALRGTRTEERRVGKQCVRTCRSWRPPDNYIKQPIDKVSDHIYIYLIISHL